MEGTVHLSMGGFYTFMSWGVFTLLCLGIYQFKSIMNLNETQYLLKMKYESLCRDCLSSLKCPIMLLVGEDIDMFLK